MLSPLQEASSGSSQKRLRAHDAKDFPVLIGQQEWKRKRQKLKRVILPPVYSEVAIRATCSRQLETA
jgi:hypothetical protein